MLEKADPFYWFDRFWYSLFGKPRRLAQRVVYEIAQILYALVIAYLIYVFLGVLLGTSKPAVIVASQSMLPTLHVGDIAFVQGVRFDQIRAPEVEVNVPLRFRTLESAGIQVVRKGLRAVALKVGKRTIPIEKNGDIVVYYNDIQGRDIIHRVVLKIRAADGEYLVTKGDNDKTNPTVDQDCYMGVCTYPFPVPMDHVFGRVVFVIPRLGIIKIWLLGP